MPQAELLRVFISSPDDLAVERDVCEDAISKLNRIYEKLDYPVRLVPRRYEEDTYPTVVPIYTQAEITRQIGPYEIYVGILGSRFGTPTPVAGSGSKAEFC